MPLSRVLTKVENNFHDQQKTRSRYKEVVLLFYLSPLHMRGRVLVLVIAVLSHASLHCCVSALHADRVEGGFALCSYAGRSGCNRRSPDLGGSPLACVAAPVGACTIMAGGDTVYYVRFTQQANWQSSMHHQAPDSWHVTFFSNGSCRDVIATYPIETATCTPHQNVWFIRIL